MFLKAFSIFDLKARAFITPFFLQNEDVAIRAVGEAVNDAQHAFGKHPEDYVLYEVGGFDDSSGSLEVKVPPVSLGPVARFKLANVLKEVKRG